MVIWLSNPLSADNRETRSTRFGVDDDIVPREVYGALVSIDSIYAKSEAEGQALLAATHIECDNLIAAAERDVANALNAADQERTFAKEQGYQEGVALGHTEWLQRVLALSEDVQKIQLCLRERMAELVILAVEQIVHSAGREALFQRALSTIDRIVEDSIDLRVSVHPEDLTVARRTFGTLEARLNALGRSVALSVVGDAQLAPGACVCESDLGIVDASLDTKLDAMRNAIIRTLRASRKETATSSPLKEDTL